MNRETIHQNYAYVTKQANIANADSPIAILTIPAGRVYRLAQETPLVLKLYTSGGTEISRSSKVYLAWQAPVGETKYQVGRTLIYGVFRDLSIDQQYDINTQASRMIEITDEEIVRFQNRQENLIDGLGADYKILLMLNSPDVVDWTQANAQFRFDMLVLTVQEFEAEKKGRKVA
jgi:hypothetical protein